MGIGRVRRLREIVLAACVPRSARLEMRIELPGRTFLNFLNEFAISPVPEPMYA